MQDLAGLGVVAVVHLCRRPGADGAERAVQRRSVEQDRLDARHEAVAAEQARIFGHAGDRRKTLVAVALEPLQGIKVCRRPLPGGQYTKIIRFEFAGVRQPKEPAREAEETPGRGPVRSEPGRGGLSEKHRSDVDRDRRGSLRVETQRQAKSVVLLGDGPRHLERDPGCMREARMRVGQKEFAPPGRRREEKAMDRGILAALGPDFLPVREVRGEVQIERHIGADEAVVGDEDVQVQAAPDVSVDLDLDAFGDDLAAARVIVARRRGGASGRRRQEIVPNRRMRFDVCARDGLDRLSGGREGEAGQEPRLMKEISVLRGLDQPLSVQLEDVHAAMGSHPFGVDT